MAIINSIFVGKPRNSAGNVVAYVRQGVPCVRSKPTPNKAYQPSVAQRQQQSVFKFLKRNIDAINFMFVIDSLWDAKPKKGKGQSKSNMFYQSWLPHLIAKRSEIAMLPDEKLVSPALFFGDRGVNLDTCTNGLLGTISSPVGESIEGGFAFDFEPAVIASLLDKANRMRPSTIPQLTTDRKSVV